MILRMLCFTGRCRWGNFSAATECRSCVRAAAAGHRRDAPVRITTPIEVSIRASARHQLISVTVRGVKALRRLGRFITTCFFFCCGDGYARRPVSFSRLRQTNKCNRMGEDVGAIAAIGPEGEHLCDPLAHRLIVKHLLQLTLLKTQ